MMPSQRQSDISPTAGCEVKYAEKTMDALNRESYALFNGAICEIKQIVNREIYKLNNFLTYTLIFLKNWNNFTPEVSDIL